MPNKLSTDKKRLTYTEFPDVADRLNKFAEGARMDRSLVIRNATADYVRLREKGKFKAAVYASPRVTRYGVRRISYAEWTDINDKLREFANEERRDLTDILREAVHTYLCNLKR
jgi:predicted transcriptional regulator